MAATSPRPLLRFDDGGWAEPVGNHAVLDLVNTVAWRLDPDRRVDRLSDGPAVIRWARFAEFITPQRESDFAAAMAADPGVGDVVAHRVRAFRERLYHVLQPVAVGDEPNSGDTERLRRAFTAALAQAQITSVMPLRWAPASQTVLDLPIELALAAWRLLEFEDPARLRQCHDQACGWLFLDRSKNASRVWCSSADCGNRTRARRHHERRASAEPRASHPHARAGDRPQSPEAGGDP